MKKGEEEIKDEERHARIDEYMVTAWMETSGVTSRSFVTALRDNVRGTCQEQRVDETFHVPVLRISGLYFYT